MRSILRTKPDKARISDEDIERAFVAIQLALSRERAIQLAPNGRSRGIPIICIEELHLRGRDMLDVKNPLVGKFLDWCSSLTRQQLAHVVFVTSIPAALKLENESGLQNARDLIF